MNDEYEAEMTSIANDQYYGKLLTSSKARKLNRLSDVNKLRSETPSIRYENGIVTISYTQGYTNEYSLDGRNWITYEQPVEVTEPTTVFARSKDAR